MKQIKILEDMDSKAIVNLVSELLEVQNLENIAILARNHFLLRKISGLLSEAGIDHQYVGRKSD